MDERSERYQSASTGQKLAGVASFGCAISCIVMVSIWMVNSQTDKAYLGGVNWRDLIFNWHPILMVSGLIFSFITSLLTYRLIPLPKFVTKTLHVVLHTAAIVCLSVGLSAVLIGNNYTNKNTGGVYYANFYSLHSMMGITAISLYCLNYLLGLASFLLPVFSAPLRRAILPHHIFLGTFTLFAAVFAAETGIMELTTELGCSYSVTSADWNPAEHYHRLPDGCRLANALGVMILVAVFLCAFALFGPGNNADSSALKGTREPIVEVSSSDNALHKA